jgi:hypothetical protein
MEVGRGALKGSPLQKKESIDVPLLKLSRVGIDIGAGRSFQEILSAP